nr:hypothetical protein [Microbacterium barkeri]
MFERFKATTVAGYRTGTVLSVLALFAGFAISFEPVNTEVRPGMYAPVEEPTAQEPGVEEPAGVEPVDIGEPTSALGKAIWSEFGESDFFAGDDAGHDPADVDPDSGRVQEPLRGDMVFAPWSDRFKEGETLTLDAGGERYWLYVQTSRSIDGYATLQILLPQDEPEGDTSPDGVLQENVFTAATAEEALALAGAQWMDNGMASGDLQYDLKTYGVKLANTTASTVTIRFDGGEYVLETQGDQGIYFIW